MRLLGTVIRAEWMVQLRSRGWWIAAVVVILFGIYVPTEIREAPWGAWGSMGAVALLVTIILVFMTGDQVIREHTRRVDGVIWSTPMHMVPYVLGKYLATLVLLMAISLLYLGSALLMDHFDSWQNPPFILGSSHFPPFGPLPYINNWLWLFPIPLIFGSALMLAALTLSRGQRIVAYAIALFLWIAPNVSTQEPELLALPGNNLQQSVPFTGSNDAFQLMIDAQFPTHPDARLAQQVLHMAQSDFPLHPPMIFLWNRAFFFGLAVILLVVTMIAAERQRRSIAGE